MHAMCWPLSADEGVQYRGKARRGCKKRSVRLILWMLISFLYFGKYVSVSVLVAWVSRVDLFQWARRKPATTITCFY